MIDKNTIYSYFQTDDFPTEAQFKATWDSFWHKSESIPMSQITGLNQLFQQTATVAQLNNKANVDGSNIDVSAYQEKLNITNLIATAKEEVKTELLNGAPEAFDTLKEISDWISDDETAEGAILQAIQNEATARTNADNLLLNKPTTTSNTTSYPFVVGEDGNGNSARIPTDQLGGGGSIDISGKLDKGGYNGTAQNLKDDIDTKQKKIKSFDESILIENDGNIEGNVSLFTEYFNQQVCELNFIPTQIIGVYQDGIKLLPEEFNITLPKTITIKTYSTEKIEIQYTHLKN